MTRGAATGCARRSRNYNVRESTMRSLIVLAVLAFSTTASAGYHYAWEVYTDVYERGGHTHASAFGSVAGALASADEWQIIECGVETTLLGGTPTTTGFCDAADADGHLAVCYTDNPQLIDVMRTVNESSFVKFFGRDGTCTDVAVWNGSRSL
jgi:hypothetical protein